MENNYQLSRIHNYIHGLMTREEMHALEREALEDPFLQDAIDGYRLQNGVDARSLSLLQQRLEKRIAVQKEQKNSYFFSWQRLAIGLVAAVMFIAVCTLLLLRHLPYRAQSNITEVELMDESLVGLKIKAFPGSDAVPAEGWEAFNLFLSKHYSGINDEKKLEVLFKVNEAGQPYDIQPQVDQSNEIYSQIIQIFQAGPLWKGKNGHVEIDFPE
ncbi:hypothetical protein [Sphingobacterium sp. LRF_L2]|uniref:hypothetical protein n=1 Tax=Sphingobacterium sp. LRF_L2 TaxID=3369421 RepID=UPI003F5F0966